MSEQLAIQTQPTTGEIMVVRQIPVIEEHLRSVKAEVDARVDAALSLVCCEDTLATVKTTRAELNREFQSMEVQRKTIKAAVLAPYEQFEETYKDCISDAYKRADAALKGKVEAVETDIKQRLLAKLEQYFAELCEFHRIDFLTFEQTGVKPDMASAKQKSPKKLMEQLRLFVESVAESVTTIGQMEDAAELMTEYKQTLSLTGAISAVQERHRRIEQEQAARAARQEAAEQRQAAVARVEAFAPPKPVAAAQEAEKTYQCSFTVLATKTQLKSLKEYMLKEGIKIL